jgi:hypothetical protein
MASMADRADSHDDPGHDDSGHADDHGATTLGPIDVPSWTAAAVGVLLGLLIVLAQTQAVF